MTDSRAAVGMDRLPWLADEPKPRPETGSRTMLGWVVAAILLIAGAAYWLGTQSAEPAADRVAVKPAPARPHATMRLPEARPAPGPQVAPSQVPEIRTAPVPTINMPEPKAEEPARRAQPSALVESKPSPMETAGEKAAETFAKQESAPEAPAVKPAPPAAAARRQALKLWPSRETKGASGRLVQIGAFGSRHQAKLGWRRMKRSYPAVARLPAVVVEARNSRGRRFYRFQIGTTSQAHSEVLCQRLQSIDFSCAVVGLPGKAKVER